MQYQFWSLIGWVIAASGIGFAISAVFAGWMKLTRRHFLIPYISLSGIFLYGFIALNDIDVAGIVSENWAWGILAGGLVGIILVRTVMGQPASRQSSGAGLAFDVAWVGLVYGAMDALFLNVMPVVAVQLGCSQFGWAATPIGKIGIGVAGLFASLLVTLTYHLGYPEFRNKSIGLVLAGNSVITLAFLLSGSPLGSIISHSAMHIAAVWQGPETTIQLPPHYQTGIKPA